MGQSGTDFRIADKTQFARGKLSIHLKIAVTIPQRSHLKALAMLPSVGNVSFGDDSFELVQRYEELHGQGGA